MAVTDDVRWSKGVGMEEEKEVLLQGKKRALRLLERKDYSRKELSERLL